MRQCPACSTVHDDTALVCPHDGEPPFVSDRMHVLLYKHSLVEPTAPSTRGVPVHPEIDDAILRALAKRPEDRYASADEFSMTLGVVRSLVDADASFPPVMGAGSCTRRSNAKTSNGTSTPRISSWAMQRPQ